MNNNSCNTKTIMCLLAAAFWGAFLGVTIQPHLSNILLVVIGILVCLIFFWGKNICLQRSGVISESIVNPEGMNIDELDKNIEHIERVLKVRQYAAERLRGNEFWIQTINIYYSCFTAVLALCSLRNEADFLTLPAACFSIIVALLVTYANAQRYGARANDLRANCIDLELSLQQCHQLIIDLKQKQDKEPFDTGYEKLKDIMREFIKKQGDSEEPVPADRWKYSKDEVDHIKYIVYMWIKACFIMVLLIIPIIYVIVNYNNFLELI